jgi:hypothetical protein
VASLLPQHTHSNHPDSTTRDILEPYIDLMALIFLPSQKFTWIPYLCVDILQSDNTAL